jgi:hypothetical protein
MNDVLKSTRKHRITKSTPQDKRAICRHLATKHPVGQGKHLEDIFVWGIDKADPMGYSLFVCNP